MNDVRDVARLHVKALTAPGVAGKRFIAASAEPVEMATLASVPKNAGYSKVPSRRALSFMLRFMGHHAVAACNEKPLTNADNGARRSLRGNNDRDGVVDATSRDSSRPSSSRWRGSSSSKNRCSSAMT